MTKSFISELEKIAGDFCPGKESESGQALEEMREALFGLIKRYKNSYEIAVLRDALAPFARCVSQISADEDDEEWAKFRLIVKDYRTAGKAYHGTRQDVITVDRVIDTIRECDEDSLPRSEYRLACNDLIEAFEGLRHG